MMVRQQLARQQFGESEDCVTLSWSSHCLGLKISRHLRPFGSSVKAKYTPVVSPNQLPKRTDFIPPTSAPQPENSRTHPYLTFVPMETQQGTGRRVQNYVSFQRPVSIRPGYTSVGSSSWWFFNVINLALPQVWFMLLQSNERKIFLRKWFSAVCSLVNVDFKSRAGWRSTLARPSFLCWHQLKTLAWPCRVPEGGRSWPALLVPRYSSVSAPGAMSCWNRVTWCSGCHIWQRL